MGIKTGQGNPLIKLLLGKKNKVRQLITIDPKRELIGGSRGKTTGKGLIGSGFNRPITPGEIRRRLGFGLYGKYLNARVSWFQRGNRCRYFTAGTNRQK